MTPERIREHKENLWFALTNDECLAESRTIASASRTSLTGGEDMSERLLPGLKEALLYFVGTRNAQAVYDNIKERIQALEQNAGTSGEFTNRKPEANGEGPESPAPNAGQQEHAPTNSDTDFGPDVTWCLRCKAVFGTDQWKQPCPAATSGYPDSPHMPASSAGLAGAAPEDDHEVLFALQMSLEHDERHQSLALRTWLPVIERWYTAKQLFDECTRGMEDETPLERLRFFCSLAMNGQDWLDVAPFFDALAAQQAGRSNAPDSSKPESESKYSEARGLLNEAQDLLAGSHASTMFEDQCGYLADRIVGFLKAHD